MKNLTKNQLTLAVGITVLLALGGVAYGSYNFLEQIKVLEADRTSLQVELSTTNETLLESQQENEILRDRLESEVARNDNLEERVEDAERALGIIVKRQSIDEELLQKYSKVYFLNEHYQPGDLSQLPQKWVAEGKDDEYIHGKVKKFLINMLENAEKDGIDLRVISAFRSFDEQAQLKGSYTVQYGSGANTFSADQGYSEHQLGTTVDLTTKQLGNSYTSIAQTEAFKWLQDNAYKYGFVLSYPEGNQYYIYEPWHWRFVGRDLARDLDRRGESFYDMDQREIDEYLVELFD